jgi:hypothetical protein
VDLCIGIEVSYPSQNGSLDFVVRDMMKGLSASELG